MSSTIYKDNSGGMKRKWDIDLAPIPKRKKAHKSQFRTKPPPPPYPPAPKSVSASAASSASASASSQLPINTGRECSPTKSVLSTWSASSYGDSPPKSRLEMKRMKRNWMRDTAPLTSKSISTSPPSSMSPPVSSSPPNGHDILSSDASNSTTTLKSEPLIPSEPERERERECIQKPSTSTTKDAKKYKINSRSLAPSEVNMKGVIARKSDTRIKIRRKVEKKKQQQQQQHRQEQQQFIEECTNKNTSSKCKPSESKACSNKPKINHVPEPKSEPKPEPESEATPAWLLPFLQNGGNIAEKVKLSRRKASMKNIEKSVKQESPVAATRERAAPSKSKSASKSKSKLRSVSCSSSSSKRTAKMKSKTKTKSISTKVDTGTPSGSSGNLMKKGPKSPLRISLKMNPEKKMKLSMLKKKKSRDNSGFEVRNGKSSSSSAAVYITKKKKLPPSVVQIRRKKKKRAVLDYSSSSSSGSDTDSSSGSSSSDSDSSSSGSSSESDSDSGSSSSSSGSSSSGSSSSSSGSSSSDDSSSSSSDSDSDSEIEPKIIQRPEKMKIAQKSQDSKTKSLKVRGKQVRVLGTTTCKNREVEKAEIECVKSCENVPKVRALTQAEIRSILAADDQNSESGNWVRRSTRQPSRSAVTAPNVRALIGKLEMNDSDMVVLKCKKYLSDPDTPSVITDAMLDALEKNTNCQALYVQNFNIGMCDAQVLHLLRILQLPTCKIWCLNIGETYNVKRRTWAQFTNGLKKTKITHMYASEHTISSAMKEKIRETIRENRKSHTMHNDPNNLDVIIQCTHCWWNPINHYKLKPYIKQGGYEYLLFDKIAQGAKDVVTDASKI